MCSICTKTYEENEPEALGHSFGEWITDVNPTCQNEGHQYRICDRCGTIEEKTQPLSARIDDNSDGVCDICGIDNVCAYCGKTHDGTFGGILSARRYKNDLSDIIGILGEHERRGTPIDLEQIEKAVFDLYGGWDNFEDNARTFIQDALQNGNLVSLYASTREEELDSRDLLVSFEKTYPQAVTQKSINDVLQHLKNRRDKQT